MKGSIAGLALVLGATVGHAQSASKGRPTVGVIVGVNLAKTSGDDSGDVDQRTGFMAGVTLGVPIAPNWSFAPELTYSQKGLKASEGNASATVKLSYLEIPVLLRFDIPSTGGVKPFLVAGPALAFKTGCSIEGKENGVTSSISCDTFAQAIGGENSLKSFDAGAMLGGGLAFDVGGRTMRLGVRYNIGLVDLGDGGDTKNRVLSFVGSFEWPFGK